MAIHDVAATETPSRTQAATALDMSAPLAARNRGGALNPSVTRRVETRSVSPDLHVKLAAAPGAVLERVDEILEANYQSSHHGSPATEAFREVLPVVGSKSARCILSPAPGEDPFAADTHVRRILGRLGVVEDNSGKPARDALEAVAPKVDRNRLHMNLAHHGRTVCTESAPRCGSCSLVSFCETGRSRVAAETGRETVVDLFGGAGAMGLGFEQAGFRIAAAVEIERHAAQTYRLNHPGVPVLEASVEDVSGDSLRSWLPGMGIPSAVIAGPPCQGYSAAGARTIGDRRNLLFRHVSRLAREISLNPPTGLWDRRFGSGWPPGWCVWAGRWVSGRVEPGLGCCGGLVAFGVGLRCAGRCAPLR